MQLSEIERAKEELKKKFDASLEMLNRGEQQAAAITQQLQELRNAHDASTTDDASSSHHHGYLKRPRSTSVAENIDAALLLMDSSRQMGEFAVQAADAELQLWSSANMPKMAWIFDQLRSISIEQARISRFGRRFRPVIMKRRCGEHARHTLRTQLVVFSETRSSCDISAIISGRSKHQRHVVELQRDAMSGWAVGSLRLSSSVLPGGAT
mmetsp:Transcript_33049/g.72637  ORF Transcript_33049/g.72637 Transcript_33049/m.72637 type:complete len:210 (-) Transcript_33049:48-677(-)